MPTHPLSLRARATFWYSGLLAVSLIVSGLGAYFGIQAYLKQSLQRGLLATAQTIRTEFFSKLQVHGQAWVLGEIRESFEGGPYDHYIRLSRGSSILYQTPDLREPAVPLSEITLPHNSLRGYFHRQNTSGGWVLVYAMPFQTADGGIIQIESGVSLRDLQNTMKLLARILSLASFITLIAAIAGGYLLMRYPLQPLVTLTETAERIGRKDLGGRLPIIHTGDELERLTHSLNAMIERLEAALAHNHRFSADASHELRTPLMIMRGEMEELVGRDDLPSDVSGNLISTLEEVDRMSRIVNSLMAITRLDAGGERMVKEPIDFAALVCTTIDHMRLLADEKGIPLILTTERHVPVLGDAMRLKQVLVNLIDNAIKYTPNQLDDDGQPLQSSDGPSRDAEDHAIVVTVYVYDGDAHLQIVDHGIGIGASSLPFVFDRFYRADLARSRGAGGVGLGLAIVKSIMAAHDGAVSISSVQGKGTTVRVRIPLAPQLQPDSPQPTAAQRHGHDLPAKTPILQQ